MQEIIAEIGKVTNRPTGKKRCGTVVVVLGKTKMAAIDGTNISRIISLVIAVVLSRYIWPYIK